MTRNAPPRDDNRRAPFDWRSDLAWVLSMALGVLVLTNFLPGAAYPPGTDAHDAMRALWWTCAGLNLLLMHRRRLLRRNRAGAIILALLGPIATLALAILRLTVRRPETPKETPA